MKKSLPINNGWKVSFLRTDGTVYKYHMVSRRQTSVDMKEYLGYGICVLQSTKQGEEANTVWDISDRESLVSELVENCNRFQLEPVHFMNVIEDTLLSQGNGFRNFFWNEM